MLKHALQRLGNLQGRRSAVEVRTGFAGERQPSACAKQEEAAAHGDQTGRGALNEADENIRGGSQENNCSREWN